MTLTTGSRVGPYQLQDRVASTESGERFTASEPGLDRPVSVVITPLPVDQAGRDAIHARARVFAGLADARLLPVYGQGDDDAVLWLTTRHLEGQSLAAVSRLEPAQAARLGGQLANQLVALAEVGLAPARLGPGDVLIEGEGATARAWLVPDPGRATADSASAATQALVRLLDERARKKLIADPPSDPGELAEALAPLGARPALHRRRALVLVAVALAVGGLAAGLALSLGSGDSGQRKTKETVIARVVARIPLNAVPYSIVASDRGVWAVTVDGLLVHVDPKTNRVVGNPAKVLPDKSYPIFFTRGNALYLAAADLIRLNARTGRVLRRTHVRGKQPFIASLFATGDSVWATVSEQSNFAESLVRYDPLTLRELSRSKPFGSAPFLALVDRRFTLAVNPGNGTLTKISPSGQMRKIAVSAGIQTAYRSVFSAGRLWIPTHIDQTLAEVDPVHLAVERVVHLGGWTSSSAAGDGSIWVLTERPSRIYRVGSASARLLGQPLPAPAKSVQVTFGAGSLWVDDPASKALIRLAPTTPAPAPAPLPPNDLTLREGPVPLQERLIDRAAVPRFSVETHDPGWLAGPVMPDSLQFEPMTIPDTGVVLSLLKTPAAVFDASGRLIRARTAEQFLAVLRRNPKLTVSGLSETTLGGVHGTRATVKAHPKPPYPSVCGAQACVVIAPITQGTMTLLGGKTDELTFVNRGGKLVIVDLSYGGPQSGKVRARGRRLIASLRFEQ